MGAGSISLISQETGVAGRTGRQGSDEVLSQILLTGVILGLPFILIGLFLSDYLIAILGAAPEVIVLGAQYLMIIFAAAPFRIVTLISARALQGTGDTRTPFYGLVFSQTLFKLGLSYGLSISLALGLPGVFIGLVMDYLVRMVWVARRFFSGKWIEDASRLISERHEEINNK